MSYNRVIPRDLFNESKLLKCIGQLALLVHDGMIPGLTATHSKPEIGFDIKQDEGDGSIYINNLMFRDESGGNFVLAYTPLNAKGHYPLLLEYNEETYFPFNEKGEYQLDKNLFTIKESEGK